MKFNKLQLLTIRWSLIETCISLTVELSGCKRIEVEGAIKQWKSLTDEELIEEVDILYEACYDK